MRAARAYSSWKTLIRLRATIRPSTRHVNPMYWRPRPINGCVTVSRNPSQDLPMITRLLQEIRLLPVVVSLDADDPELGRLDESLAASSMDSDALGFASDMRDLDRRSSRPGRRSDWLGDEAA